MTKDYIKFARLFKDIGNPIRLKLILLLLENEEKCLCELQPFLNISQPALSRHINLLREHKIITQRKEANRFFLKIKDENVIKILKCLNLVKKMKKDK